MPNFSLILQELLYKKTRVLLTVLAIAWGTFSISTMLAVGEGLRLNFSSTMANAGNNLLDVSPGITAKNYQGTHANTLLNFTKRDIQAIAALPNIANITPQYNFKTLLRYYNRYIYAELQATHPEHATIHNIQTNPKQRFISPIDFAERKFVIVIGANTAQLLFPPEENPAGNIVYINNHPFTIIGVMQSKPQMNASGMPDEFLNWIPSSTYELLTNPKKIDKIAVAYKDFNLLPQTKKYIQKIVALNHGYDPYDDNILEFSDLAETQKKTNRFFIGMQIFFGFIGALTLIIAEVGIANVMYASVTQATNQIGIQMALGARKKDIICHYIFESLIATIIGGIIGFMMTVGFVFLIRLIPMHGDFFTSVIGKPKPVLSFLVLTIVIISLGITSIIAGLFPALKAAKIDPAEALVYE